MAERAPAQGLSARSHQGVRTRTKEKTEMKKNIAIIALAIITAITFASCDPAIETSLIEDETVTVPTLPEDNEKSPSIDYPEPGTGDEDTEEALPPETEDSEKEDEELPSEETPSEDETPEEEAPEEEPQDPGFWIDEDGVIHISVTEG